MPAKALRRLAQLSWDGVSWRTAWPYCPGVPPADKDLVAAALGADRTGGASDVARRLAALGGVAGPAAFIGAWIIGSTVAPGYSAVDDPISRLAAVGVDTRSLMTAGFVAFGLGVPLYATALRTFVGGLGWLTAVATGLATIAVAAIPLGHSTTPDGWHGVAATIGYVTLAATPVLAARPLRQRGHRRLARLGVACAYVSAASLVLSATRLPTGLFQRIGLTSGHLWIMATAIAISSARRGTITSGGNRHLPD